jgi:hypothetical protein
MKRENPTPAFDFQGLSSDEMRMIDAKNLGLGLISDKRGLSDIEMRRQARRFYVELE